MIKITEVCNRGVLSEGRSCGFAFGMLKQKGKNNFETVNPCSPCKDYLNEVILTENTGLPTSGCGLKYPIRHDIYGKKYAYMAVIVLPSKSSNPDTQQFEEWTITEMKNWFENNYKQIQHFLNAFEERIGLLLTTITKSEGDHFLVKFDKRWCQSTYTISLYTLLFRLGRVYHGEDLESFFKSFYSKHTNHQDSNYVNSLLNLLNDILTDKVLPEQDYKRISNVLKLRKENNQTFPYSPHGLGIVYFSSLYGSLKTKEEKQSLFKPNENKFVLP